MPDRSFLLPPLLSGRFCLCRTCFFWTAASVKINSVSDGDSHSHDHLLHGSAAEACRNASAGHGRNAEIRSSDFPSGTGLWDTLVGSTHTFRLSLVPIFKTEAEAAAADESDLSSFSPFSLTVASPCLSHQQDEGIIIIISGCSSSGCWS